MISRRDFSKMAGVLGLTGLPTAALSASTLEGPMPAIVDASVHCDGEAKRLKDLGVKVVIRYYALHGQKDLEEKRLMKEEADRILDSGLSLAISYQYLNSDIHTFTPERGAADAAHCLIKMDEINQPKDSTIYFGVDHDWIYKGDTGKIAAYFSAVKANSKGRFKIGVYGSGFTCMNMESLSLAEYFWIAGLSDGWSGRLDAMKAGTWNMYQNILELPVGSIKVDTDVVNPKRPGIGSFHRPFGSKDCVLDGPIIDERSVATQRIAIRDIALFNKPHGAQIRILPASKMVVLIREEGEYSVVDVPRQIETQPKTHADFVRGFCKTDALVKVDVDLKAI